MKKSILLSILSGILLWLAWPPMHYTAFLLFIGFVPMLIAMEEIIQSNTAKKGKKIFHITFLGFFIWNTACIYWVYNSLKIIGPLVAIPITLIPYTLGPLLMSTACWLYYRLRLSTKRGWSLVGLVCFWIGYEYLHQTWDLAFPWMTLGNGFAVSHQWVQWYEYTGVYGGTLWVWIVNILVFLIYTGLREGQQSTRLRQGIIAAFVLILSLPICYSIYKYDTFKENVDPSNIVVAQPNIDPYAKEGDIPVKEQIDILTHESDSLGQANTEFFIWPETAIAEAVDEGKMRNSNYYLQAQHFLSKYHNGNIITGAETYKLYSTPVTSTASPTGDGQGYFDSFNSAVNIENSAEIQYYHKSKLVPGAEEIPFSSVLFFLKPAFAHLGGAAGSYGSQPNPSVFYSQSGIGADPVICYESIWGEYVATSVHMGAQFIAIITNDGWWENTTGKDQHLDYAKLRAIETRRWVCRSANTGISAFINERGDIVQRTKWWTRTALKQDINLNQEMTFYVLHGDYIPKAACILAIFGVIFILIRTRFSRNVKS